MQGGDRSFGRSETAAVQGLPDGGGIGPLIAPQKMSDTNPLIDRQIVPHTSGRSINGLVSDSGIGPRSACRFRCSAPGLDLAARSQQFRAENAPHDPT